MKTVTTIDIILLSITILNTAWLIYNRALRSALEKVVLEYKEELRIVKEEVKKLQKSI